MTATTATRPRRRRPAAAAPALEGGALLSSSSPGQDGVLLHLAPSAIDPTIHPNPRGEFPTTGEEWDAFVASVEALGVMQPVGAAAHPEDPDRVALTMGWRRHTAASQAGCETIPVYVSELRGTALQRAIAENSARLDLTPLQEAHAIKSLMDEEGLTQVEAGTVIGRSERTVRERLRLLKVPPQVAAALDEGTIPVHAGPTMHRLSEACPNAAEQLARRVRDGELAAAGLLELHTLQRELEQLDGPTLVVGDREHIDLDELPKGEGWDELRKAYRKVPKRHGWREHLYWNAADRAAAAKAGAELDLRANGQDVTIAVVEDEAWLRERIAKVIERTRENAKKRLAADRKAEAERSKPKAAPGPDELAAAAAANARIARTQRAAHEMNLELGRTLLKHTPKAGDVLGLLALLAVEREALDAAAAAYYLIDPAVQTLVVIGGGDPWDTLKVPVQNDARRDYRTRIHAAKDAGKVALLVRGAIAALWVDPRSLYPEAAYGGWQWEQYRHGDAARGAVEAYAAKAGIAPPARADSITVAARELADAQAAWAGTPERLRLLHELGVNDKGLNADTLLKRAASYSWDLPSPMARQITADEGPEVLEQLVADALVTVQDDTRDDARVDRTVKLTDAGRDLLAHPPAAPTLRDVDEHLTLVYPPGADAPAEEGELVLEGRTRGEQALSAIRQRPGITIPELAEVLGVKQNYLYRVLPALEQDGEVRKDGRGWHPAPESDVTQSREEAADV